MQWAQGDALWRRIAARRVWRALPLGGEFQGTAPNTIWNHPAIPLLLLPVRMKSHRRIFRISPNGTSTPRVGSALKLRGSLSLGTKNGQLRRFPCCDAAGNFRDRSKSPPLQQTRGDGRPVAARAVKQERT